MAAPECNAGSLVHQQKDRSFNVVKGWLTAAATAERSRGDASTRSRPKELLIRRSRLSGRTLDGSMVL